MKHRLCRGFVTADVLLQGLSRGAIATRKLKGVNRDKGHERFILVQPLTVKEGLRLVGLVLLEVSMTRERDTLCLALDELFLALSRWRVVPLYTRVDALWPTESRPAHKQCPTRRLVTSTLQYKLYHHGSLSLRASESPVGL